MAEQNDKPKKTLVTFEKADESLGRVDAVRVAGVRFVKGVEVEVNATQLKAVEAAKGYTFKTKEK